MSKKTRKKTRSTQSHTRVVDTLITRLEKKALLWMAPRLPKQFTPDTMTALGVLGSVLILIGYILTNRHDGFLWLATFGFVLNWFGDSLDGTLARVRKIERPRYGFFIDHILDAIGETMIFVGLGLSPYVNFNFALFALVAYLLGSIYVYLNTYINGVFRLSYGGLSPTEFRLIAIAVNTTVFFGLNPTFQIPAGGILSSPLSLTLFDIVVLGVMLAILYLFLFNTIRTARVLAREEKPVVEKSVTHSQHEKDNTRIERAGLSERSKLR